MMVVLLCSVESQFCKSKTEVWGTIHPRDTATGFVSDFTLAIDESTCNGGEVKDRSSVQPHIGNMDLCRSMISIVSYTDPGERSFRSN